MNSQESQPQHQLPMIQYSLSSDSGSSSILTEEEDLEDAKIPIGNGNSAQTNGLSIVGSVIEASEHNQAQVPVLSDHLPKDDCIFPPNITIPENASIEEIVQLIDSLPGYEDTVPFKFRTLKGTVSSYPGKE